MAGKIFINYRRDDERSAAARVRDRLVQAFGGSNVFMDVDNLMAGQRFDKELEKALAETDVFLAVIGPRWMDLFAQRQSSAERDYVREEIAGALKRDIVVIPVLIERASLPRGDALPEDIRDLVLHQKHPITHEQFGRDIAGLVEAIRFARKPKAKSGGSGAIPDIPWGWVVATAASVLVLGWVGAYEVGIPVWWPFGKPSESALAPTAKDLADAARRSVQAEEQKRKDADAAAKVEEERKQADIATAKAKAEAAKEQQRLAALKQQGAVSEAESKGSAAKASGTTNAAEPDKQSVAMKELQEKSGSQAAKLLESVKGKDNLKPGDTFRDCPDVCPEMVVVPAGEFTMGSPSSEVRWSGYDGREEPQHKVAITKPFAVGKFEVTRDQFEAFVKATGFAVANECLNYTGSEWKEGPASFRKPGFDQTGSHPAVCVSWDDAKAFVGGLSKTTDKSYRLLSEAEWEYAARGGTTTPFSTGATISTEQANYDGNYTYGNGKKGEYRKKTVEVGSFVPNAFGLRDMHGNAAEWVEDSWHPNYQGAPNDGSVWPGGDASFRVQRGGSWGDYPQYLRSAFRHIFQPAFRLNMLGFRVARTLE